MEIAKIQYRIVIQFLVSEGRPNQEIHERLVKYLGDQAPSKRTVDRWILAFKRGKTDFEDDDKPGRPKSATDEQTVEKIKEFVNTDRRLKVREIAQEMGISTGSVHSVLSDILGMKKLSARWVPRLLTVYDEHRRVQYCEENLFMEGEKNFFSTLVTGDETWCYYYDPETKEQSREWRRQGSPPPRKAKREKSAGKGMATVFWDCEGVVLVEFMPKGSTINGPHYAETLKKK